MARSQRSKIRQRRRAPLRAKYEERLKQAFILKHKLMAIEKANKSKLMEVSEAPHVSQPDRDTGETNSNQNKSSDTVSDKESQKKPLSKSKLKKQKESRKRKRLGIRKGQWKWS